VDEIFGNQQPQAPPESLDLSNLVKDLMRRVRVLEERYSSIRKNIQVNEQNVLKMNKKVFADIKSVTLDIADVKRGMHGLKDEVTLIIKELKESVKKEEVQVLEKYIKLWEPLNFVTHNEMEQFVGSRRKK